MIEVSPVAGDATTMIQEALSQGAAENRKVLLTPGVYETTGVLVAHQVPPALDFAAIGHNVPAGIEGYGATLVGIGAAGGHVLRLNNCHGRLSHRFRVAGLRLDGAGLKNYPLVIDGLQRFAVDDVASIRARDAGVLIRGAEGQGVYYGTFRACDVSQATGTGILAMTSPEMGPDGSLLPCRVAAIELDGCTVALCGSYGVQVRYATIALRNCAIEKCGAAGVYVPRSFRVDLAACYFEHNGDGAVDPQAGSWTPDGTPDTAAVVGPHAHLGPGSGGVEIWGGRVIGGVTEVGP